MGKSTISIAIFNNYVTNYQRVTRVFLMAHTVDGCEILRQLIGGLS